MSSEERDDGADSLQEFVKLLTDHQWSLRGFILSLMPGSPDVGDVLQNTNLVLWQKRKRFKHGSNFLRWACRVARYEVMHYRDRVRKHAHLPFSDELINVLAEPKGIDGSQEALLTALDICLEQLSEKHRDLIVHRYTPGKSLKAHAKTLGTSAESLRVTLHRIRQALRNCVKRKLAGGTA